MIDEEIKRAVIREFAAKAKELGLEIIIANGTEDHMHVLLKSPPRIAPSDIAKELKGASSHLVNHVTLKDNASRSLYWQDGYGVESVSPSGVNSLTEYIRRQAEHHRDNTVAEEREL